jgi:hypothetical protein
MAFEFRAAEHADLFEHRGVSHRAENVVLPQPPVERDGFGERATSAAGPAANRPLRAIEFVFM